MHDQMVYGHGFQVQACSLMYKKILRLNQNGISQVSIGKIVNIMSNDVIRYNYCLIVGFQGIMAPIVIGVRKESKSFPQRWRNKILLALPGGLCEDHLVLISHILTIF